MEENTVFALEPAKKAYNRMGFGLFTIAAVTTVLQGVLAALAMPLLSDRPELLLLVTFAPLYLIGVPAGLLIMRKAPREAAPDNKLGVGNFFVFLLMCFPLMYGGNLIGTLLSSLLTNGSAQNPLNIIAFNDSPIRILVLVVLAPLVEEFIFRKQLIDRTVRYGEKTAILFSALCFGLFHMNLFQFFYAFALGLLFAYIYTRTRRLRYSLLMHMIVNFLGSVLAPYLLSRMGESTLEQLTSGQIDPEAMASLLPQVGGFILYAFCLVGFSIAGLVLLIVKAPKLVFRSSEQELPKGQAFRCVYLRPGVILFVVFCILACILSLVGLG